MMVDYLRRFVVVFGVLSLLIRSTFEQQQRHKSSSFVEQIALLELRSSLGLRSRDWPRKADPCLVWNGVECNGGGRVSGINISGFRRTRIGRKNPQFAVDSLANLTMLVSFNSSNFALPGTIPVWFGERMKSLQVLDLRSCSIVGIIPSSLGNSTNLTGLYLSNNALTGIIPSSLGQLSRLSVLDLAHNTLTGSIPSSFSFLRNLTVLDISSNFLSGSIFPAIGSLSKLQTLNLSSNSLSSSLPAQLGDLSSLVDLDLSFNSLSGSLPNDSFTSQNQLQFIALTRNNFIGTLPIVFWSMPTLRFLDVSRNNLTGSLPNISLSFNSTAPIFNLSRNFFYGNLTSVLMRFGFVDLDGNYFEGKVPDYALTNASVNVNCLQNVSNQRTLSDCQSFYSSINMIFDNFGRPNGTQPPLPPKRPGKSHKNLIILASVIGGIGLILLLLFVCVILFICARKRGSSTAQRGNGVGPVPTASSPPPPGVTINFSSLGEAFTYQQLLQATSDFSDANLIKHGHSGDLFRGMLEGGIPVVIKRVNLLSLKKEGYLMELDLFSKASHTRLVPFLGHCLENENEKFLVYKYMPNEDLSNSLYKKTNSEDDSLQSLDWITRLKIATGAAEGLTYLHHECTPPLVHRDVQASSILLDDKFEVRLGSLSEVCPQEGDTHQRMITRLLRLPQSSDQGTSGSSTSTCAYDVYCFGKVLLELVTGKLGISASNETSMKEWLEETLPYISIYDKELVIKIVDPSLIIDEDLLEEVWAMAIVARSCLNPKPSRRPLMRYILKALENPFKVVREESSNSARLRATSSRGSWNAALFGSWRQSSSDVPATSTMNRVEAGSSLKQSGGTTTGSQGSGLNGGGGGEHSSSSRRRHSNEIYPQPSDVQDV